MEGGTGNTQINYTRNNTRLDTGYSLGEEAKLKENTATCTARLVRPSRIVVVRDASCSKT
jgi:hypothetical protein